MNFNRIHEGFETIFRTHDLFVNKRMTLEYLYFFLVSFSFFLFSDVVNKIMLISDRIILSYFNKRKIELDKLSTSRMVILIYGVMLGLAIQK